MLSVIFCMCLISMYLCVSIVLYMSTQCTQMKKSRLKGKVENSIDKGCAYPEEIFAKSQVSAISCGRNTRGLFHTGIGIREKAYGPARGGLVTGRNTTGGPMSGLSAGRPGAGIGRLCGLFEACRLLLPYCPTYTS